MKKDLVMEKSHIKCLESKKCKEIFCNQIARRLSNFAIFENNLCILLSHFSLTTCYKIMVSFLFQKVDMESPNIDTVSNTV